MKIFRNVNRIATALVFFFLMVLTVERAVGDERCTLPKDTMVGSHMLLMKEAGLIISKVNRGEPISGFEMSFLQKLQDEGVIWFTFNEIRDIKMTEADQGILEFDLNGAPAYVFRDLVKCSGAK